MWLIARNVFCKKRNKIIRFSTLGFVLLPERHEWFGVAHLRLLPQGTTRLLSINSELAASEPFPCTHILTPSTRLVRTKMPAFRLTRQRIEPSVPDLAAFAQPIPHLADEKRNKTFQFKPLWQQHIPSNK